jgi:hypothetical protein
MKRPRPSGRTKMIGEAGRILTEGDPPELATDPPPSPEEKQQAPRPFRGPNVPLSHGRVSEQQVAAWRRQCLRRSNAWTERDEEQYRQRWGE